MNSKEDEDDVESLQASSQREGMYSTISKLEGLAVLFVLPVCWIAFLASLWHAFQFNASYVYLVSSASYVYTDPGLSMNLYLQQRLLLYGIGLLGFFMILKLMVLLQSAGSSGPAAVHHRK